MLNGFGTVVNSLQMRAKPYLPQFCGIIKWRLNNKNAKLRQQAADLIARIAIVMKVTVIHFSPSTTQFWLSWSSMSNISKAGKAAKYHVQRAQQMTYHLYCGNCRLSLLSTGQYSEHALVLKQLQGYRLLQTCDEEKLLGHLGVVLYEYLGEEYPEVLGSILGALKSIVNVIGMSKMTPPIKDLLPRLTPILKNRHEKVQENCIVSPCLELNQQLLNPHGVLTSSRYPRGMSISGLVVPSWTILYLVEAKNFGSTNNLFNDLLVTTCD